MSGRTYQAVMVIYGLIMSMLIGCIAYVSYEKNILKDRLADVQSTVRMLDEELQQVYKVE
jgi:Tfp pilus assembly protein PilE